MSESVETLLKALQPLVRAVSEPGIGQINRSAIVQLRDWGKGPMHDWQCGGFTYADLIKITDAYEAVKKDHPLAAQPDQNSKEM